MMELKQLHILWLQPGEDDNVELNEYTESVRETKKGFKAEDPETSPFGSYQFKADKQNCLIRKGTEGLIMYGFDYEELIRSYAGAILPSGYIMSGGVLSSGKPEYEETTSEQKSESQASELSDQSDYADLKALLNENMAAEEALLERQSSDLLPEDLEEYSDCDVCGETVDTCDVIIVNSGFPDQRVECSVCNAGNIEIGTECCCNVCGAYFDTSHLNNGDCPYCGANIEPTKIEDVTEDEPAELPETGSILIYTDGSCIGNPGPGGWAALLQCGSIERVMTGGDVNTTNNRMELMGPISALQSLNDRRDVTIVSDSKYVVDAINKGWAKNWQQNHWVKGDGSPAKNPDLWDTLLGLIRQHNVTFRWMKGHSGDPLNERCDRLAAQIAERYSRM